ncbi:hypothetical protein [Pseudonocardia sp. GCM10023141]|uniref:hypothetical protein n=1 Tax=Pseudonocardia sp. GCM10023141 TaxID=3252653 RepID=UPI00360A7E0B
MTRFGPSPLRVVVGAGTGASLPRSLRRIGAHVEVHEQTPAVERVGAELQLGTNATSAARAPA